jgi:hypothetical protein
MEKFIRVVNPSGLDYLKELLTPTDELPDQETVCEVLKKMLMEHPNRCFFILVFSDDIIAGHIIAFVHPSNKYVSLFSLSGHSQELISKLVIRMTFWAEQIEIPEVRYESKRIDPGLTGPALGFVVTNQIFTLNVDSTVETMLSSTVTKKEPTNAATNGQLVAGSNA